MGAVVMSGATLHFDAGLRRRPQSLFAALAVIFFVVAPAYFERASAADWPGGPPILRGSLEPGFARWDRWQFGVLAAFAT